MANIQDKSQLPDILTDENVTDPNFFRGDLKSLYDQVEDITAYTDKIKNDLDKGYFSPNREMMHRGSMVFAGEELKAITSLFSTKASVSGQIISAKTKLAQISNQKKKDETETNGNDEYLTRKFQELFTEHKSHIVGSNIPQQDMSEDIEAKIAEMEQNGSIQFSDNELAIKYERRGVEFKVLEDGKNTRFVAVTKDTGELINDYPLSLYPDPSIIVKAVRSASGYDYSGTNFRIY